MDEKWYIIEVYFDMGMTTSIINLTDVEVNTIKKYINREFIYEDMYAPDIKFFDNNPYSTREDALYALEHSLHWQSDSH